VRDANERERAQWRLGLSTRKSQKAVMEELYRALRSLNCVWKPMGPWQLRCRWRTKELDKEIKVTFQLYSLGDGQFLLDIRTVSGELQLHFDFCAKLMTVLRL
jgi:hypothetical protein